MVSPIGNNRGGVAIGGGKITDVSTFGGELHSIKEDQGGVANADGKVGQSKE